MSKIYIINAYDVAYDSTTTLGYVCEECQAKKAVEELKDTTDEYVIFSYIPLEKYNE